jgi:hypothetical protein
LTKPISLELARYLNALSLTRPILSENTIFTAMTLLVALLSSVPGAIWAGAISPRISTTTTDRQIHIPSYVSYPGYGNWTSIQSAKGTFTNDPSDVVGLLLYPAQRASNLDAPNGNTSAHAKLDNTGYTFYGRNFGAGSFVGISSIPDILMPLYYTYEETGIVASTSCQRNATSTFEIVYNTSSYGLSEWPCTTGYTAGTFQNGDSVPSIWLFGALFQDLFAVQQIWYPDSRRAEVVVASAAVVEGDTAFPMYKQMQCEATFTAHTIRVSVNTTSQTITTEVLDELPWPVYADAVMAQATFALTDLTYTDNGFGGSRVAQSMMSNTKTLYNNKYGVFPGTNISDDILAESIADFVTNVFENMLTFIGACRNECAHPTTQLTAAKVTVPSVLFGNAGFIYAVFIMSVSTSLVCAYFIVVKRAWNHIAELDFTDISDVALNASKSGTALYDLYEAKGSLSRTYITLGDPSATWPGIACANYIEKIVRGGSALSQRVLDVPLISTNKSAVSEYQEDTTF